MSQPCLPSNHHVLAHLLAHHLADIKGENKTINLRWEHVTKKVGRGKAMAMGIRVAGDKEGERDEAGDGVGNKG